MEWDAEDLRASLTHKPRGLNIARENELLNIFTPFCKPEDIIASNFPLLQRPAVVVDSADRILLWSLPEIFNTARQVGT